MAKNKMKLIDQYQRLLPASLSQRYGGSGPYTMAQVERTMEHLRLDRTCIYYAYLIYCEKAALDPEIFTDQAVANMSQDIDAASMPGAGVGPLASLFGIDGFAGDGGCDGGGAGGGGE
tara:strand:- start:326 stop:679 length:354 start_codon:yes stop_codon:yes gene_type:complete